MCGLDNNDRQTGFPDQDIDYYLYNQADLTNIDVLSVIPLTVSNDLSFSFKPYYSNEDSSIFNGVTSMGGGELVQKRNREIDRYGLISEAPLDFDWVKASLGYWVESVDMNISTQNHAPGTMEFLGYGVFTENDGNGWVHSPYIKLSGKISRFDWQAGLKYFHYLDPATKGYVSNPPTYRLVHAPDLDRYKKEYDEILLTIGLAYNWTDTFQIYSS